MPAAPGAERLVTARLEVRRACDLLISPSPAAFDGCQVALARAVSQLTEFRSQCGAAAADVKPLAYALRAEIVRANRLLRSLASFYRGWERILGTMSGGYTAGGDPAPVTRMGRLYCRG
jgi:hypothetical protein